jgi:uncharacterized protein
MPLRGESGRRKVSERRFPPFVTEHLGFYVYTLSDPITNKIFYVGKGTGNRVFAHAKAAIRAEKEIDRLDTVRKILRRGRAVRCEIIRHGMTDLEAYHVESALIDYIGLQGLSNKVSGRDATRYGRMSVQEIIACYGAKPIRIKEPSLLIIVNRLFERNIAPDRLYEITRGNWVLGKHRNKAQFAFSAYKGVVREVYRIDRWARARARNPEQKQQERWRFTGAVATELQDYVGGSVEAYLKRGAQSPVRYINC